MPLRFPRVMERWRYDDPARHTDGLNRRPTREHAPRPTAPRTPRDRYYTQARRLHIRNVLKGAR